MANIASITGIVLAGGKSTRIGANKPQLKIGKSHLIDRVLDTLSQFTQSIIIVTTEDQTGMAKSAEAFVNGIFKSSVLSSACIWGLKSA